MNKVMDDFFEKWEQETIEWFEEMKGIRKELGDYNFSKEYKTKLSKINMMLIRYHPIEETKGLAKSIREIVAEDMVNKKAKVYAKVTKKVGEIKEVNLYCGEDGTPNGTITGTNGTVRIDTIIAGGYNVQCLHYRVLVK